MHGQVTTLSRPRSSTNTALYIIGFPLMFRFQLLYFFLFCLCAIIYQIDFIDPYLHVLCIFRIWKQNMPSYEILGHVLFFSCWIWLFIIAVSIHLPLKASPNNRDNLGCKIIYYLWYLIKMNLCYSICKTTSLVILYYINIGVWQITNSWDNCLTKNKCKIILVATLIKN